ncbi:MAG TPA: type II toxin-antitoxin system antitoxin SocA domain-containing protein [Candidatus Acidoferrum sp.]|nr:type II toxin-antitoxin system antitoxin SocA domain-containing protein [Candidatus Acidoferrum sp.]
MPYDVKAVVNEFLKLARESNEPLSPMKLQKLVYFAHGWHLAVTGTPLISEPIEAWAYGPVVKSIYHDLKIYGSDAVTHPCVSADRSPRGTFAREPSIDDGPDPGANEMAKRIIRKVWTEYGRYSASRLANMTHDPASPWSQTQNKNERGVKIDNSRIRDYFVSLARRAHER